MKELNFEELRTVFSQYFELWRLTGIRRKGFSWRHWRQTALTSTRGLRLCPGIFGLFGFSRPVPIHKTARWQRALIAAETETSFLNTIVHATINSYVQINSGASCSSQFIWASKQSQ
jgi:hypothetical protein